MRLLAALVLLSSIQLSAARRQEAPELKGKTWYNTDRLEPITLRSRHGFVTVVEFFAFTCSNCIANLPAYNRVFNRYLAKNVTIIGVHTPETERERDLNELRKALMKWKINYPIVVDPDYRNWNAWNQRYWPAVYVVDKHGRITFKWEGELAYQGATGEKQLTDAIDRALSN